MGKETAEDGTPTTKGSGGFKTPPRKGKTKSPGRALRSGTPGDKRSGAKTSDATKKKKRGSAGGSALSVRGGKNDTSSKAIKREQMEKAKDMKRNDAKGDTAENAIMIVEGKSSVKRSREQMKDGESHTSPEHKRHTLTKQVLDFERVKDNSKDETEIEKTGGEPPKGPTKKSNSMKTKTGETRGANTSIRIPDPYKRDKSKTQDTQEQAPHRVPVTYAKKASSPQQKICTHSRIQEAHDGYYEVSFQLNNISHNPGIQEEVDNMHEMLKAILIRAREVDRKAKINAWHDEDDLPTIAKIEDIPVNSPTKLKAYLSPNRRGLMLKQGRNNGWRVRMTTKIERKEFVHYWSMTKHDFNKVQYVSLKDAPLQDSTYHAAGCFLNSGDNQIVEELEKQLGLELGFPIGIQYKPAALDKRAADELWKRAKKAKFDAPRFEKNRTFFKHAPFAQQVYAATRQQAHQAALVLSEKYGTPDKDLQYPRLPDGSRMRFIAASVYLDMQGKATAAGLFPQQVIFTNTEVVANIPIRDPLQRFPTQGDKTMQQLLLDLKDPEMGNEPYFRHVRKKFHWNYKCCQYEVSIHGQMFPRSMKILKNLNNILREAYDEEVARALVEVTQDETGDQTSRGGGMSGISIATEDRYLNGPAKFIIEGIEKVSKTQPKSLHEIRKEADDATINIRSTTSGMTGDTGNTVPDPQETFMDSIAYNTAHDHTIQVMHDHGTKVTDTGESAGGYHSTHETESPEQGSKRNTPEEGNWTVHGSANSVKELAKKVAASFINSRGSPGGQGP